MFDDFPFIQMIFLRASVAASKATALVIRILLRPIGLRDYLPTVMRVIMMFAAVSVGGGIGLCGRLAGEVSVLVAVGQRRTSLIKIQ